ncbi:MAG: hypothetical protein QM713_15885 [Arachnia sp.]
MSIGRNRIGWQIASAALLTGVVAWMAGPTYPVVWAVDPNLQVEPAVTYHSWLSPMTFGYGAFHTVLTFVCALLAAASAWYGVAVKKTRRTPAWWALSGAVILVIWSAVLGSFDWSPAAALVGLLAGAGAALIAARAALPARVPSG